MHHVQSSTSPAILARTWTETRSICCPVRSVGHQWQLCCRAYSSILSTAVKTRCLSLSRYVSMFAELPQCASFSQFYYSARLRVAILPLFHFNLCLASFSSQIRSGQSNSTVQCVTQSGERFIKHIQIADRNNILWTIVQAMLRKLQCCDSFIQPRSLGGRCTKCKGASFSNAGGWRQWVDQ